MLSEVGLASEVCSARVQSMLQALSNRPLMETRLYPTVGAETPVESSLGDPESLWVSAAGFLAFIHGVRLVAELSLFWLCFLPSSWSSLVRALHIQPLLPLSSPVLQFMSLLQPSTRLSLKAFLLLPYVLQLCNFSSLL